jgi:hypothetical protein
MASHEQELLMDTWEKHTGFEFMGKEEVRANDPIGFLAFVKRNVRWLEDWTRKADDIFDYYRKTSLE